MYNGIFLFLYCIFYYFLYLFIYLFLFCFFWFLHQMATWHLYERIFSMMWTLSGASKGSFY
ncbi:hypothetical protein Bca101_068563 [Brassica carinata]